MPNGLLQALLNSFRDEATRRGVDYSLFWPTETGLEKSILDATAQVRLHFAAVGLHDYAGQGQGQHNKVQASARFLRGAYEPRNELASFYRPETKNGDPRMWFRGLRSFARPGDTIAIVVDGKVPYLINLQEIADEIGRLPNLTRFFQQQDLFLPPGEMPLNLPLLEADTKLPTLRAMMRLLARLGADKQSLAMELLHALRGIASRGSISTTESGSKAVGRAVEQALGINPNSSKDPDYKGQIELKSARATRNPTRQTLFAQVADWSHEKTAFRSSAKILDEFGYDRGGHRRLYCTVSTKGPNSQGLRFELSADESLLMEMDARNRVVAVWPLALLVDRLLTKHAQTFWIKALSKRDDKGVEHFTLLHARHTKAPLASQLLPLLREGLITMDHLIKRYEDGTVTEKGPLFKLAPEGFKLLFPHPDDYSLQP